MKRFNCGQSRTVEFVHLRIIGLPRPPFKERKKEEKQKQGNGGVYQT